MNIRSLNAAFAATALLCLPSVASAQMREPVRIRIAVADLNLANASGRAALEVRVRHAVRAACGVETRDLAIMADQSRCRREMEQDGRAQIATLLQPQDVRFADAGAHIALAR